MVWCIDDFHNKLVPLKHVSRGIEGDKLPSDTKCLLTKNYSKIIIFEKLRISRVKSPSLPKILRVQNRLKITKKNSQGIIFVIISCQRVNGTNGSEFAFFFFFADFRGDFC